MGLLKQFLYFIFWLSLTGNSYSFAEDHSTAHWDAIALYFSIDGETYSCSQESTGKKLYAWDVVTKLKEDFVPGLFTGATKIPAQYMNDLKAVYVYPVTNALSADFIERMGEKAPSTLRHFQTEELLGVALVFGYSREGEAHHTPSEIELKLSLEYKVQDFFPYVDQSGLVLSQEMEGFSRLIRTRAVRPTVFIDAFGSGSVSGGNLSIPGNTHGYPPMLYALATAVKNAVNAPWFDIRPHYLGFKMGFGSDDSATWEEVSNEFYPNLYRSEDPFNLNLPID